MRRSRKRLVVAFCAITAICVVLLAAHRNEVAYYVHRVVSRSASAAPVSLIENPTSAADRIVNGAKMEVLRGVTYDASYAPIPYPNGDVPRDHGACTDVVIRALRNAGYDLQKLIHEDMAAHFGLYPRSYGLSRPDPSIDHRRVPNQKVFFRRHGKELPISTSGRAASSWQPGDIVYWRLGSGPDHCGIVSNDRNSDGRPLVIHNIGLTAQEDCLTTWEITGHFRYPPR